MTTETSASATYNIPLLSSSNYTSWSVQMKMILKERRVWKVIMGEESQPNPPPAATDDSASETPTAETPVISPEDQAALQQSYEKDLAAFEEKVDKANAVLFATITPALIADIQGIENPAEVWKVLEQRYAPKTDMSKMTAWMNFINARLSDDESVPDYLLRLARYKTRCLECGSTVDETMHKSLMLNTLPDAYNAIKANAMVSSNMMTAEEVKDQILEQYRVVSHVSEHSGKDGKGAKAFTTQHKGLDARHLRFLMKYIIVT